MSVFSVRLHTNHLPIFLTLLIPLCGESQSAGNPEAQTQGTPPIFSCVQK
jgi:hypothetical protein